MTAMRYMPLLAALAMLSCSNTSKTGIQEEEEKTYVKAPELSQDSAYLYVKEQCDFGPRTPGTDAHRKCGDYIAAKFRSFGAEVTEQKAKVRAWDGKVFEMRNIIASYRPESGKRVIICSHWDSRPWADNDPDKANHHTPIDGADDGASGVGIMLEMARHLQDSLPGIGVDLICFDLEDYGHPSWYEGEQDESSWCLGSQYWSRVPHKSGYNARFGILLDMVGNAQSVFFQEYFSKKDAGSAVRKIWNTANRIGFSSRFPKKDGGAVTDDHIPLNDIARIPTVDIIPYYENCQESSFGPVWHSLNDNIEHIDAATLKMVGQVIMEVIYNEK